MSICSLDSLVICVLKCTGLLKRPMLHLIRGGAFEGVGVGWEFVIFSDGFYSSPEPKSLGELLV